MLASWILAAAVVPHPAQLAAWHNIPIRQTRLGQARPWRRELQVEPDSIMITAQDLLVNYGPKKVTAIDSATGRIRWETKSPFPDAYASPDTTEAGAHEVGTNILLHYKRNADNLFACFDSHSGKLRWKTTIAHRVGEIHKVGNDVAVVALETGPVVQAPVFGHIEIWDGATGAVKAKLSPKDEAANRQILQSAAPTMANQFVIFDSQITRNGVPIPSPGPAESVWIVAGRVVTRFEYEDFPMDLGDASALTQIKSFPLETLGQPNPVDQWKGRGTGRAYRIANCQYYGGVAGEYRGQVLTTFIKKTLQRNGDIVAQATPVAVSGDGDMTITPLTHSFNGGAAEAIKQGFLMESAEGTSIFSNNRLTRQPRTTTAAPFEEAYLCQYSRDGIVYRAQAKDHPHRQLFISEPYRLR